MKRKGKECSKGVHFRSSCDLRQCTDIDDVAFLLVAMDGPPLVEQIAPVNPAHHEGSEASQLPPIAVVTVPGNLSAVPSYDV